MARWFAGIVLAGCAGGGTDAVAPDTDAPCAWAGDPALEAGAHLLTTGPLGAAGVAPPLLTNSAAGNVWKILVLGFLVGICIFVSLRIREGRLGRAWLALREDELAASMMGVPLVRVKLLAYAVGAFFGGIGGVANASAITRGSSPSAASAAGSRGAGWPVASTTKNSHQPHAARPRNIPAFPRTHPLPALHPPPVGVRRAVEGTAHPIVRNPADWG